MYKNKEERIELIEEMRSTHALQEQDMNRKKLDRQDIQAAQYTQRKDISKVMEQFSLISYKRFQLNLKFINRKIWLIQFFKLLKAKLLVTCSIIYPKN